MKRKRKQLRRVGFLGIRAGRTEPWCVEARKILTSLDPNIETWDPEDDAWKGIDWSSSDIVQPIIDEILTRQLEGIKQCDALVLVMPALCNNDGSPNQGLGARLELGRTLMTRGIDLRIVLDPHLDGRHYIRAHFPHALARVKEYGTVKEAIQALMDDYTS